jgi:hypothetical protein
MNRSLTSASSIREAEIAAMTPTAAPPSEEIAAPDPSE